MLERQVVDSGGDDTAPAETTTAKVAKAMARTSLPDHDHRGRGARGSKRTRGTSEVRAAAGTAAPGAASTKTSANANTSTNTDDYSSVACSRSQVVDSASQLNSPEKGSPAEGLSFPLAYEMGHLRSAA